LFTNIPVASTDAVATISAAGTKLLFTYLALLGR
jgi:hypothetical protein